jgi:hypothetical protein
VPYWDLNVFYFRDIQISNFIFGFLFKKPKIKYGVHFLWLSFKKLGLHRLWCKILLKYLFGDRRIKGFTGETVKEYGIRIFRKVRSNTGRLN